MSLVSEISDYLFYALDHAKAEKGVHPMLGKDLAKVLPFQA